MASTVSEDGRCPRLRLRSITFVVVVLLVVFIAVCAVAKYAGVTGEEARDTGAGQIEQTQTGEQGAAAWETRENADEYPAGIEEKTSGVVGTLSTDTLNPSAVCPVTFVDAYEESARHSAWGDGWTFVSARDIDEDAARVLETLQTDGWDLMFASGLDLAGQAWGCVAFHEQRQETVLAYMVPRVIGRTLAADNPLVISIVRVDHAS